MNNDLLDFFIVVRRSLLLVVRWLDKFIAKAKRRPARKDK